MFSKKIHHFLEKLERVIEGVAFLECSRITDDRNEVTGLRIVDVLAGKRQVIAELTGPQRIQLTIRLTDDMQKKEGRILKEVYEYLLDCVTSHGLELPFDKRSKTCAVATSFDCTPYSHTDMEHKLEMALERLRAFITLHGTEIARFLDSRGVKPKF